MTHTTRTLEETAKVAATLAQEVVAGNHPQLILLQGDLGGGKTTFCQAFGKALGIEQDITSPTFVIMKSYPIPGDQHRLHHLDLYRIEKAWELEELGLPAVIEDPDTILLVEWPNKTPEFWTDRDHTLIEFQVIDETTRTITIHHNN